LILLVSFFFSFIYYSDALGAVAKVGGKCTKVEALVKSGNQVLACTRNKSKLIWKIATVYQTVKYYDMEKAAAAAAQWEKEVRELEVINTAKRAKAAPGKGQTCLPEKKCLVGSKGPGGGTVFYDAGKTLPWGRYLEYAPNGWLQGQNNQDPQSYYCSASADEVYNDNNTSTHIDIGSGKKNTEYLLARCGGAAALASSFAGGGKKDWYLPSKDELNEVCKFEMYQETGDSKIRCEYQGPDGPGKRFDFRSSVCVNWWTSSLELKLGWGLYLNGMGWPNLFELGEQFCVRPIRAF